MILWAHPSPGISTGSAIFAQMTVVCPNTSQCDAPSLNFYLILSYGISTPSDTWFPGPTRVLNPNSISIGSAVFAGLTSVTDRLTDHATRSVTIGHIYVCSTAMWPKS